MNKWVLLEHRVSLSKKIDIHYDFLLEQDKDCLTWKLLKIPLLNKGSLEIISQPNHRLVWLNRNEYKLSRNRGFAKRIDYGTYTKVPIKSSDSQDLRLILNGRLLNGLFEISGNLCRLTKRN